MHVTRENAPGSARGYSSNHRGTPALSGSSRIDVKGLASWRVLVEDTNTDLFAAIDLAAHRASHAVIRTLERFHQVDPYSSPKSTNGAS